MRYWHFRACCFCDRAATNSHDPFVVPSAPSRSGAGPEILLTSPPMCAAANSTDNTNTINANNALFTMIIVTYLQENLKHISR